MRHRQQARELSDGYAFLQGKEGCARREREESGVISKAGIESRIQSPGQRVQAAGSPGCRRGDRQPSRLRQRCQASCGASRGGAWSLMATWLLAGIQSPRASLPLGLLAGLRHPPSEQA